MLSTTAGYLAIASNLSRSQATTADDPSVSRATAYFLANIGKVKTVSDFVNNYRLLSYAMKAYGLEDMTYAKGLMTKVLNGGVSSSTALANTLSDPRYKAFATAFDFAGQGSAVTQSAAATTGATFRYVEQTLEDNQGKTNKGIQLALYFQRNASSITSAYGLLADKSMLTVVQTAFGISPYSSQSDISLQAAYLDKVLPIADLQDPKKVASIIQRFTAQYDAINGNNVTNVLLLDPSSGAGLSSDVLMSINGVTPSSNPTNVLLANSSSSSGGLSSDLLLSIAGLKLGGS